MNPLKFVNGRYEVDFEDFERRAADPDCSPLPALQSAQPYRPCIFSG